MKNTKRNLIVCCAAILCIMVIAVGCTPKEPAKTEEPTAEVTAEATEQPTEETATETPDVEATPEETDETAEETAEEITYTDEEIAAAKKAVEEYLSVEEIEAESVEVVADHKVANQMKFTVKVKDTEETMEVIVTRADSESDWTVKENTEKETAE